MSDYYLISSCNSSDRLTFAIIKLGHSVLKEMQRIFYALETVRHCICGPQISMGSLTLNIHNQELVPDVKDYESLTIEQLERLHTSIGESPPDSWAYDISPHFAKYLSSCPGFRDRTSDCRIVATSLGIYFEMNVQTGNVSPDDVEEMYTHPIPWGLIREWADQV
jgi:hypothetical protein